MSINRSAEIRWIFEGKIKENIKERFNNGTFKPKYEERDDQYLVLAGLDKIGIKLREKKLEFKPLVSSKIEINLPDKINGKVELWEKWSLKDSEAGAFLHIPKNTDNENWIKINKSRFLRKYSMDNGISEEVNPDYRPDEGCGVEITGLIIDKTIESYWTLGFEAFGSNENIVNILSEVINNFFTEDTLISLNEQELCIDNSKSYPEFLTSII